MVQKNTRKKRYLQINKRKKKERNKSCGHRGACISKDEWPRLQRKHKYEKRSKAKATENKRNTTERRVIASANQTPGGYKFTPPVASQQGRANQHEPACFGLSSPWPFPSRSGIPLHAVVQPFGFLCNDPFCHEVFRPLFCRCSAPFPLVLDCSRLLVRVDAESSEVVQETPHPLFFLPPPQPAPPTISPNVTHFGSLVSSMRATNPANKIRLLRVLGR